ncbi:MAG: FAD-dependent oxidoreductase, partial [Vicinamibacteria bacterium]
MSNGASDIIVIGAGFAGLSAAARLAAAGRRVLVLE